MDLKEQLISRILAGAPATAVIADAVERSRFAASLIGEMEAELQARHIVPVRVVCTDIAAAADFWSAVVDATWPALSPLMDDATKALCQNFKARIASTAASGLKQKNFSKILGKVGERCGHKLLLVLDDFDEQFRRQEEPDMMALRSLTSSATILIVTARPLNELAAEHYDNDTYSVNQFLPPEP